MSDGSLTDTPAESLQHALDCLFHPVGKLEDDSWVKDRLIALETLAALFISKYSPYGHEDLQFDWIAARLMIGRFHRDAFGLHNLEVRLQEMVSKQSLSETDRDEIMQRIGLLGLRISSAHPMKTRIAAAFSLWMSTFRPISLKGEAAMNDKQSGKFCAALNFWIAAQYLRKFGNLNLGSDAQKRYERIHHDFTFRALNISSLELLYCSVFSAKPRAA